LYTRVQKQKKTSAASTCIIYVMLESSQYMPQLSATSAGKLS